MTQLDELRRIIVGDNSAQLAELKHRLENLEARTRDVAEVLAPAIDAGLEQSDELIETLKRPVSQGLKQAISKEPEEYANILYPAIAPSIRLAISEAINSLLASINKTLESATSVSGLKTRIHAWRSGVPYAELVLHQSLTFQVEHVYLIHRDSGLSIEDIGIQDNARIDSDMLSAMFSAIQSFVQDSFSGNENDRLTDFKVGEHTVWIAHGSKVMLAIVIYGEAPGALKLELSESLETIARDFSSQIYAYQGDSSPFTGLQDYLRPILHMRLADNDTLPDAASGTPAKVLLLILLLMAIGYFIYSFDRHAKLEVVRHYLDATPGVLSTDMKWQDGKIEIQGLLDRRAVLPLKTLAAYGIDEDRIELKMKPYISPELDR